MSLSLPGLMGVGWLPPHRNSVVGVDAVVADHPTTREGRKVSVIRFQATTTSSPEQFVAGLTDFGPRREQEFPNSADSYLEVTVGKGKLRTAFDASVRAIEVRNGLAPVVA
jgi:hypothetical protein